MWLRETMLPLIENPGRIRDLLQMGAMYGYRRDKNMSPILILNVRLALDSGFLAPEIAQSSNFLMTFTKYAAFLPGKIEQWIFIVDGLDVSVFDVPW